MSRPWRFPVSLAGILCLAPMAFFPLDGEFMRTVGFTLIYLGFGTLLMLAIYKEPGRKAAEAGIIARGIALMGLYSYTIYLWHFPLIVIFQPFARPMIPNEYLLDAICFAASILAGVAAAKLVEIPVLKLRDRMDLTRMDKSESKFESEKLEAA